jgi:RNA polymerase sigma factor (sigma-70 family)
MTELRPWDASPDASLYNSLAYTPEQDIVRQAFLGRVALENSLDWGPPADMEPQEVETRFQDLSAWLHRGLSEATPAVRSNSLTLSVDFLEHMRSGRSKESFLADGTPLSSYRHRVESIQKHVSIALDTYRNQEDSYYASLSAYKEDVRLETLLDKGMPKREAVAAVAYEDGWSSEEAEAAFGMKPAIWRRTERTTKHPTEYRSPVLSAEREVELAKTIEVGTFAEKLLQDFEDGQTSTIVGGNSVSKQELVLLARDKGDAVWEFVTHNKGLVFKNIHEMWGVIAAPGKISTSRESINQLGKEVMWDERRGLLHAVYKFDFKQSIKFSVYATQWIRNGIYQAVGNRLPVPLTGPMYQCLLQLQSSLKRVRAIPPGERTLEEQALANNGDPDLAVAATGISYFKHTKVAYQGLRQYLATHFTSLNEALHNAPDGHLREEIEADPRQADLAEHVADRLILKDAIGELTAREQTIIQHYFGFDKERLSSAEMCERYGWKTQDERRWREDAMAKMRQQLSVTIR